jgi:N4-(beta-N-acetylglucosaminyl)-L-asparaginase
MSDRREFLRTGIAGAAALMAGCGANDGDGAVSGVNDKAGSPAADPGRIVLATWDHGIPAVEQAWRTLEAKGSALDAAEQGVMVTESDLGNRSVGLGGTPDRDGRTTLDACIQDHDGRCGAVACLEHIEHPISVARAIMERTPHVMLVGEGAHTWALANGFTHREVDLPEVRKAYAEWLRTSDYAPVVNRENHDTIGLVVRDADGRMAGSCTTSGMAYKIHGRVGDSPIIGAGLFVDGDAGAACSTGTGELVIRTVGSHTVVELMRQGVEPMEACRQAIRRILRFLTEPEHHQVGFIALRSDGVWAAAALQGGFTVAVRDSSGTRLVKADALWTTA